MDSGGPALYLVAIAVLGAIAGAGIMHVLARRRRLPDPRGRWPYRFRPPLNQAQQQLYLRLRAAFPGFIVLAQVRLSRLLEVGDRRGAARWKEHISRMSVDFVVMDPDFKLVGVVELDTTAAGTQRVADLVKARALQDARVPLVRWSLDDGVPDVEGIHQRFKMLAKQTARRAGRRSSQAASTV